MMRLLLATLFTCLSSWSWAQSCLTQLNDIDFIMKAKEQGTYRRALDNDVEPLNLASLPTFSVYLSHARDTIAQRNPRAHWPCPVHTKTAQLLQQQRRLPDSLTVLDLLSPFELSRPDSNKVALLFHGLTDSPFSYHSLAAFFYQQGYNVRTVLLPGHATAADDLRLVEFEQWQALTDYAIARTSKDFDEVIIGGYSTGAALAISYLVEHPVAEQVKALMLWSPATEPHNKNGWLSKWVDAIPFVNWIDEDADIDFAKYESFPFAAASLAHEAKSQISVKKLARKTLPNLPVFIAQSDIDTTIDATATLAFAKVWHDPQKRPKTANDMMVFYGDKRSAEKVLGTQYPLKSYACADNTSTCADIINLSHVSVINSAQHPYYGAQGIYRNCGSYLEDDKRYRHCKTAPQVLVGERTTQNLSKGVLKRVTYNPFFKELERDMHSFLERLE